MDASSAPSAATSNQHWRILLVENDALALAKFGSKRGFFDDDVFFKLIDEKEYRSRQLAFSVCAISQHAVQRVIWRAA